MTDKLWLLPFGPDQIHLPTLHSPDSAGFLILAWGNARGFVWGFMQQDVVSCGLRKGYHLPW